MLRVRARHWAAITFRLVRIEISLRHRGLTPRKRTPHGPPVTLALVRGKVEKRQRRTATIVWARHRTEVASGTMLRHVTLAGALAAAKRTRHGAAVALLPVRCEIA